MKRRMYLQFLEGQVGTTSHSFQDHKTPPLPPGVTHTSIAKSFEKPVLHDRYTLPQTFSTQQDGWQRPCLRQGRLCIHENHRIHHGYWPAANENVCGSNSTGCFLLTQ